MNFFDTPLRRKFLFGSLYFSEGAPIGFLWLALPTRLREAGTSIERITWLMAILVLPWTFKFVWAPLVDLLQGRRWTQRHWIVSAQCVMGITLLPLLWLDPIDQFEAMSALLLMHAFAAATQDVAIDALCISATDVAERGQYNGWMQAGMLLGRASMGGGALVLATQVGDGAVIVVLVLLTTFSSALVIVSPPRDKPRDRQQLASEQSMLRALGEAIASRKTWIALLFAAVGGASFKSLEVIYGPFLVDRGFDKATIGWFSLGPMIGAMLIGSLLGGWLADRAGRLRCVIGSLIWIIGTVITLAITDLVTGPDGKNSLLVWLAASAFGIGLFTASSYAMFMDLTEPRIAATQFSTFMGATNGCESWSSFVIGILISSYGYPPAMLAMACVSLISLPLISALRPLSPHATSPRLGVEPRATNQDEVEG